MARSHSVSALWLSAHSSFMVGRGVVVGVLACLIALQPSMVSAQFPGATVVFDPQNLVQNVRAAVELAREVQLTLQDLAPLADIGLALNIATNVQILLVQVRVMAEKMKGRKHLWGASYPIASFQALAEFRSSSQQLCRLVTTDALGIQSMIADAIDLLVTANTIIESADVLIRGTVSGLHAVSVNISALGSQLVSLQTMLAGNNEAGLCESWARAIRREAIAALQQHMMRDHGQVGGVP